MFQPHPNLGYYRDSSYLPVNILLWLSYKCQLQMLVTKEERWKWHHFCSPYSSWMRNIWPSWNPRLQVPKAFMTDYTARASDQYPVCPHVFLPARCTRKNVLASEKQEIPAVFYGVIFSLCNFNHERDEANISAMESLHSAIANRIFVCQRSWNPKNLNRFDMPPTHSLILFLLVGLYLVHLPLSYI